MTPKQAPKTIFSPEHKAAIAKARTGTHHTEETKQKIKASWIIRKARTQQKNEVPVAKPTLLPKTPEQI